jgi:hypothetical protein
MAAHAIRKTTTTGLGFVQASASGLREGVPEVTSLITGLIAIVLLCGGVLLGSFLRDRLPDHHVRDDSKEVVKTASGMIATLVALIVGLLVSSSKAALDQANEGLTQAGAKVILLDQVLSRYGPEAKPIRGRMKELMQVSIERLWPSRREPKEGTAVVERSTGMDEIQSMIEQLTPSDEPHRAIRTRALDTCNELMQSRWLMIEKAQTSLPVPFLVMLIFWLTVLFTGFGLLAPRNPTTVTCLFVCAISMAGAIVLILEMNRPFEGAIQASPGPLLKAVSVIGR